MPSNPFPPSGPSVAELEQVGLSEARIEKIAAWAKANPQTAHSSGTFAFLRLVAALAQAEPVLHVDASICPHTTWFAGGGTRTCRQCGTVENAVAPAEPIHVSVRGFAIRSADKADDGFYDRTAIGDWSLGGTALTCFIFETREDAEKVLAEDIALPDFLVVQVERATAVVVDNSP